MADHTIMTHEEAIVELCTMRLHGPGIRSEEAVAMASAALRRACPEEPVYLSPDIRRRTFIGTCPFCGNRLLMSGIHLYCPDCGQSLNWPEWDPTIQWKGWDA